MGKLKLNSLNSSNLKEAKLKELGELTNYEKQKIFGGSHTHSQYCTSCEDTACDAQYTNNKHEPE